MGRETVKQLSRIELWRETLARVKREMEQPRLAESVRNAMEAEAALADKHLAAQPTSARSGGISALKSEIHAA